MNSELDGIRVLLRDTQNSNAKTAPATTITQSALDAERDTTLEIVEAMVDGKFDALHIEDTIESRVREELDRQLGKGKRNSVSSKTHPLSAGGPSVDKDIE